ncbi:hypothetical protein ABLN86_05235, partial [Mycobacterium tuberculosis]
RTCRTGCVTRFPNGVQVRMAVLFHVLVGAQDAGKEGAA